MNKRICCIKMIFLIGYLLVATWSEVMGQSHTTPSDFVRTSVINDTTTAVPLYNVSTTNGHTRFVTTLLPMTSLSNGQRTTKTTYESKSSILSRLTSIAASPTVPISTSNHRVTVQRDFPTTTATPPFVGPTPSYRQFDALSFAGGALITISLVILGTYGWKMYMARIERSYWTL